MSGDSTPVPPPHEGVRRAVPALTGEQRARLAQRLSQRTSDRGDSGQVLPLTRTALAHTDPAQRLESLIAALAQERVVLPIGVEQDPRDSGVHTPSGPGALNDFPRVATPEGPALVAYSSAGALATDRAGARPAPVSSRTLALTALVETSGRVLVDPGSAGDVEDTTAGHGPGGIRLPRPAVAALAQGDTWLPAWRDLDLLARLREVVGAQEGSPVLDVRLPACAGATQRVEVVVDASLDPRRARAVLARGLRDLSEDARLRVACELVEIVPVRAFGV